MDKKSVLMDSVKRLLELGISDKDIVSNLKDVGIPEEQAVALLAETKAEKRKVKEEEKKEKEKPFSKDISLEEISPKGEMKKETFREKAPEKSLFEKEEMPLFKPRFERETDVAELWEKGIITAVDQKLGEMQRLKIDLEKILDEKIDKSMEKEMKKVQILFDSRKALLTSKINEYLEEKAGEVSETIQNRIEEIKKLNFATQEDLKKTEAKIQIIKNLYDNVNAALSDLDQLKAELTGTVTESTTALKEKMAELDERISRTLELESKITQGLINEAKNKVDTVIDERITKLEDRVKKEIEDLELLESKVSPEKVGQRIDRIISEKTEKLDELVAKKMDELEKIETHLQPDEVNKNIEEAIISRTGDLIKRTDQRLNELKALDRNLSAEAVDKKIDARISGALGHLASELDSKVREFRTIKAAVEPAKIEEDMSDIISRKNIELEQKMHERLDIISERADKKISELIEVQSVLNPTAIESEINRIITDRLNLLDRKIQERVYVLEKLEAAVSAENIDKLIDNSISRKMLSLTGELDNHIEAAVENQLESVLHVTAEDLEKFKQKTLSELDVDKLITQFESLEDFKKRFDKTVDAKIAEVSSKLKAKEDSIDKAILTINRKVEDLNNVEKDFAQHIDVILENLEDKVDDLEKKVTNKTQK